MDRIEFQITSEARGILMQIGCLSAFDPQAVDYHLLQLPRYLYLGHTGVRKNRGKDGERRSVTRPKISLRQSDLSLLKAFAWKYCKRANLLMFQVNALIFVACDGGANLGRGLACLGLLVGEDTLFGASVALG